MGSFLVVKTNEKYMIFPTKDRRRIKKKLRKQFKNEMKSYLLDKCITEYYIDVFKLNQIRISDIPIKFLGHLYVCIYYKSNHAWHRYIFLHNRI